MESSHVVYFYNWEKEWDLQHNSFPVEPSGNPIDIAKEMFAPKAEVSRYGSEINPTASQLKNSMHLIFTSTRTR
jgi:hypothetical protein